MSAPGPHPIVDEDRIVSDLIDAATAVLVMLHDMTTEDFERGADQAARIALAAAIARARGEG